MNDGDVSRQIQPMVRFIRQEAEEKANEISVCAEEEFNIEKLQLVEAEKKKIRQEYEKKEKQADVRKKITAHIPKASSFEEDSKDSSYAVLNSSKSLANEKNTEIDCHKPCWINHMLCFEEKTSSSRTNHSQTNGGHEKSSYRFLEACIFIPSESSCINLIHT